MNQRRQDDTQRVVVFIDYQNVMEDARRAFHQWPYGAADGQIDPVRYAQELTSRAPPWFEKRRALKEVRVYRGRPHSEKDPKTHAAHMRQVAAWEKAGVRPFTRDLRYPRDWPNKRAEEKGIDVALAIHAVMMAVRGQLDVAIIASTDTDLRPVLEAYALLPGDDKPTIETATWTSVSFSKKLTAKGAPAWVHRLDEAAYQQVQDTRDYNIRT